MMTFRANSLNRRAVIASAGAAAVVANLPGMAIALTNTQARELVDRLIADINGIINSGKSETAMYVDFERLFSKYAFVKGIARSVLGPPARSASKSDMAAFTSTFQGYISRKYGRRFREFIGGKIVVDGSKPLKSFYEVKTTALLAGLAPFDVTFMVSDVSGKDLFFDMLIEGISMLKAEKTEIGAMLDKRKGNLGKMIGDLKLAG